MRASSFRVVQQIIPEDIAPSLLSTMLRIMNGNMRTVILDYH
jgi:hypothetical protein